MTFRKPHQTADLKYINWDNDRCLISPKGLNIIWGNDHRYWNVTNEYAELKQVSWLEVSCKVKVDEGKKYSVKFVVEVKAEGFGWGSTEVLVMAKYGKKGQYKYEPVKLDGANKTNAGKQDLEIELPGIATDPELHFGLYEVWSGKWKGGLKIYNAEIVKKS